MKLENVADVYPLSPMQEGMLFHTIAEPESGVYVDQVVVTLVGELSRNVWPSQFDGYLQSANPCERPLFGTASISHCKLCAGKSNFLSRFTIFKLWMKINSSQRSGK